MQIRILCGVNHEDLKQLFHVSNSIRAAVSVTKALFVIHSFYNFIWLCSVHKFVTEIDSVPKMQTVIAKRCHFAYSTPSKTRAFRSALDFADWSEVDDIEAPDAPKQTKQPRSRLCGKKLDSISVALFASADEDHCSK